MNEHEQIKTSFQRNYKIFAIFAMAYITISVACDVVAYKIVAFAGLPIIGASILFPLLYVLNDVITELFGGKVSRVTMWIHVVCDFFFTYLIILIIHLPSPDWWHHQSAYDTVVNPMGRMYIANLIGIIVSTTVNIGFLSKWKVLMHGKFFALRSIVSSLIGILLYTIVTDLLAYSSYLDYSHLIKVTLTNLTSNVAFGIIYVFIASFVVRYVKAVFKIDHFDKNASFNPFKL